MGSGLIGDSMSAFPPLASMGRFIQRVVKGHLPPHAPAAKAASHFAIGPGGERALLLYWLVAKTGQRALSGKVVPRQPVAFYPLQLHSVHRWHGEALSPVWIPALRFAVRNALALVLKGGDSKHAAVDSSHIHRHARILMEGRVDEGGVCRAISQMAALSTTSWA
jgi:hypothetical protein